MPIPTYLVVMSCLFALSGCAAVAVGGAVVGVTSTVVGTTVSTTTKVAGATVGAVIPDGDDDD